MARVKHFICQSPSPRPSRDAGNRALGSRSRPMKKRAFAEKMIMAWVARKGQVGRKKLPRNGAVKISKTKHANNIGNSDFFLASTVQTGQGDPKSRRAE